eukprot:Clim_evm76s147 gene=Clim_evmTU76s147
MGVLGYACIGLLLAVAGGLVSVLIPLGLFIPIAGMPERGWHHCTRIENGYYGIEDMQFVNPQWDGPADNRKLGILSSDNRKLYWRGFDPNHDLPWYSRLVTYDLETKRTKEMKMIGFNPDTQEFRPHGLGVGQKWQGYSGKKNRIYVVNHTKKGDFIEVFDWKMNTSGESEATYVASISHKNMADMNDVVPVSDCEFYVTRFFGTDKDDAVERLRELYLGKESGSVLYVNFCQDPKTPKVKTVAEGLNMPNGINMVNEKTVVVSGFGKNHIRVFERNPKTNDLAFRYDIPLGASWPDNIDVGSDGFLYVASITGMVNFWGHTVMGVLKHGGIEALRVNLGENFNGEKAGVDLLVSHPGLDDFGTTTVVAYGSYKNETHVLLGSLMNEGIADCVF